MGPDVAEQEISGGGRRKSEGEPEWESEASRLPPPASRLPSNASRPIVVCLASGALLALAFPAIDLDFVAWIALAPLLWSIVAVSPGRAFWLGWLAGSSFSLATLYWVVHPISTYTPIPLVGAVLIVVLMCAVLATATGFFAAAVAFTARRGFSPLWFAPCWWVTLEWLRSWLALGFPWDLLGYTQYRNLATVQIAEVTGVYGLSALLVLANALVAAAFRPGEHLGRRLRHAGAFVGLLLVVHVLGSWRHSQLAQREPTEHLRAAVVQGSIPQELKWDPAYQETTLATYEDLTRRIAGNGVELVVWPETATPFFFQMGGPFSNRVTDLTRATGAWLLFGSPGYERDGDAGLVSTNRAYLLSPTGAVAGSYDKVILVPFGEYVPFQRILFFVGKIAHSAASLRPGSGVSALPFGSQRAGVLICYETIFPLLARRSVAGGATVLVNVTNDAWFGRTSAPYQHLAMAVLRAVENRVPLIRAANTGISAFVLPDGRIEDPTPLFEPTFRLADLAWTTSPTIYTRYGDVFAGACAVASFLALLACVIM